MGLKKIENKVFHGIPKSISWVITLELAVWGVSLQVLSESAILVVGGRVPIIGERTTYPRRG